MYRTHRISKEQFPFTLLSGSWDCSIRVWDMAAASGVCCWPVARAVTSFTMNPAMPQLATSHEDGPLPYPLRSHYIEL